MSDGRFEDRLHAYYDAWGTGSADAVLAFFAEGAVFEDLALEARFEGVEAIRSFVAMTYAAVPDFRVKPEVIVVAGDRAAASWTMSGTHEGDLPGLPATGKPFSVRASSIIARRDGLILHITDYWNPLSLRSSDDSEVR